MRLSPGQRRRTFSIERSGHNVFMKPRIKRKWSRVASNQKGICRMPGCAILANQRCRHADCNHLICREHKGAHSAVHTILKRQGQDDLTRSLC